MKSIFAGCSLLSKIRCSTFPHRPLRLLLACGLTALSTFNLNGAAAEGLPPDATITSGGLTVTLAGEGWRRVPASEGKISVIRTTADGWFGFAIWPIDPASSAQTWTTAQHTKAYFQHERSQPRAPGTRWSGFAESVRNIQGRNYPMMSFSISGREWKGGAVDVDGVFLLVFPEPPAPRGRFYVVMWDDNRPTSRPKSGLEQLDVIMSSLVIGGAAGKGTPPADALPADDFNESMGRALKKMKTRDFAGAVADFNAAIERDPQSQHAFTGRGIAKSSAGDDDGALADFDQALKLNDATLQAYFSRGQLKAKRGDLAGALRDYNSALVIKPDWADALYQRAAVKAGLKDVAGAIQDMGQFIELRPTQPSGYFTRGTLRRNSGDLDGAILDLTKAIELQPDLANAYHNRGACRSTKGDLDGALADFDKTLELNPRDHLAYHNRAGVRQAKGDPAGAIADLDAVVRLQPNWAGGYLSRGGIKQNQGDHTAAIADLTEAIRLQPNNTQAFVIRAAARKATGDAEGAKADRARAEELAGKK